MVELTERQNAAQMWTASPMQAVAWRSGHRLTRALQQRLYASEGGKDVSDVTSNYPGFPDSCGSLISNGFIWQSWRQFCQCGLVCG